MSSHTTDAAAVAITQADTYIAVEQAVAVAVFGNQQQAAMKMGRCATAWGCAAQQLFDAGVEVACALRAFAHGRQQAQT